MKLLPKFLQREPAETERVCEPPIHRTFPLEAVDERGRRRFIGHGCRCGRVVTTPGGAVSRPLVVVAGRVRASKSHERRVHAAAPGWDLR